MVRALRCRYALMEHLKGKRVARQPVIVKLMFLLESLLLVMINRTFFMGLAKFAGAMIASLLSLVLFWYVFFCKYII